MPECRVARITLFYNPDCLVCDRLAKRFASVRDRQKSKRVAMPKRRGGLVR